MRLVAVPGAHARKGTSLVTPTSTGCVSQSSNDTLLSHLFNETYVLFPACHTFKRYLTAQTLHEQLAILPPMLMVWSIEPQQQAHSIGLAARFFKCRYAIREIF
jgi:hypothetical protein